MKTLAKIPYVNLSQQHVAIKEELLQAVAKVIGHGNFILGEEVAEFEKQFAKLCGVKHAIGVNSGTDALMMILRALDIGQGDEVITVSGSFVTTATSIVLVGAKPVFVDVGEDYNIDPARIEKVITQNTKAILPVHLTGRPADMDAIREIAQKYKLHILEDCAQAVCAQYKNKSVGSFGAGGAFSLHPLKTLNACGDGGILVTNDEKVNDMARVLRDNGFRKRNDCIVWSNNSRLDSMQAAILLVKMKYLQQWTEKRRENAKIYQAKLKGLKHVQVPQDKSYEYAVYHTFVIQADDRDDLAKYLAEQGVDTRIHYPVPIHLQSVCKDFGFKEGSFPETEKQMKRILSLPIYAELTEENLEYVTNCIHDFYQKGK